MKALLIAAATLTLSLAPPAVAGNDHAIDPVQEILTHGTTVAGIEVRRPAAMVLLTGPTDHVFSAGVTTDNIRVMQFRYERPDPCRGRGESKNYGYITLNWRTQTWTHTERTRLGCGAREFTLLPDGEGGSFENPGKDRFILSDFSGRENYEIIVAPRYP